MSITTATPKTPVPTPAVPPRRVIIIVRAIVAGGVVVGVGRRELFIVVVRVETGEAAAFRERHGRYAQLEAVVRDQRESSRGRRGAVRDDAVVAAHLDHNGITQNIPITEANHQRDACH